MYRSIGRTKHLILLNVKKRNGLEAALTNIKFFLMYPDQSKSNGSDADRLLNVNKRNGLETALTNIKLLLMCPDQFNGNGLGRQRNEEK